MASDRTYELVNEALEDVVTRVADSEPDPWFAVTEAAMRIGGRHMDDQWKRHNSMERLARKHRGRK